MKLTFLYSLVFLLTFIGCSHKKETKKVQEAPAVTLTDAYTFGFPLVLMDVTRETMTNASRPGEVTGRAPVNQFVHMKVFPDASFTDVVRPNVDTLYSSAWLDLSKGAMVLEIPDTDGRYYLMQMLDAWTNVYSSPGKRTTGTEAQKFVIAGPKWNGTAPEGYTLLRSPTDLTWIIGRVQANSVEDAKTTVATIQKDIKLYPIEKIGESYTPPAGRLNKNISSSAPMEKVYSLTTEEFFNRLNRLLVNNPPTAADKPMMDRFARVGIAPGAQFTLNQFQVADQEVIKKIPSERREYFQTNLAKMGTLRNNWLMPNPKVGKYQTDYLFRATVAHHGLGANLMDDAIYPTASTDGLGKVLNGSDKYVLHFEKEDIPSVNAFWSLTVYGEDSFLVENPINRFAIGDRNKLTFNRDGSLDIYLQKESPGAEKESNWLPIPSGNFTVTARLYWPTDVALGSDYVLPPIMPRRDKMPISFND